MKTKIYLLVLLALIANRAIGLDLLETSRQVSPSSPSVTFQKLEKEGVIAVTIQPGESDYPGISIQPTPPSWDGSAFSHIVATIKNTGTKPLTLNLRVDNSGDWRNEPWNVEKIDIKPGETKDLKTYFGFQYGYRKGFPLDPAKIIGIQLFSGKVNGEAASFSLLSLTAQGKAGDHPNSKSEDTNIIQPKEGVLFSSAPDFDSRVKLHRDPESGVITIGLNEGFWDISHYNQIALGTDDDASDFQTRAVDQGNHVTDWQTGRLLFESKSEWQGKTDGKPDTKEYSFDSRKVKAIEIRPASSAAKLEIHSVKAVLNRLERPDWMGQRPPVPGKWKLSFSDEFEGDAIDGKKWNIYGPNYWGDKHLTHWSRENVIVKDGTASIRMDKKTGFHNDDSTQHSSPYAGGYLDTYDKWRQRYGYFEARVKLPGADGLWPAFWMMPDAGRELGPMGKRQVTEPVGMEFDIMEYQASWGPFRYHIAMHWDGYGKNHKSIGTSGIYFSPDEEGYVTAGLLWLPDKAVFYSNGKEVGSVESQRISKLPGMFILTMPIGGWDNKPVNDSQLPADFVIDYVKAWQREDLASEVDGFYE